MSAISAIDEMEDELVKVKQLCSALNRENELLLRENKRLKSK
ncbi:putative coiled coil protein [Candidatus Ichthyocystis hellenicum]|uniref:Putative coiled coil protein n=1 Tax=Candidatus Ichthyocystis hellenicum TaxID=1561003 RepID=A0A0S4M3L2_9BURK|nr:putative coiled coil protein [Candidatus Ichthyocystis hellenicum]